MKTLTPAAYRNTLLFAAAVASLINHPASANSAVRVQISSDARVTYQRLQHAAQQLCGSVNRLDLARYGVWTRCYRSTLQQAVEQVNDPVLLALHRQQAGKVAS